MRSYSDMFTIGSGGNVEKITVPVGNYISGVEFGFSQWGGTRVLNGITRVFHSRLCSLRVPEHTETKYNGPSGGVSETMMLEIGEVIIGLGGYIDNNAYIGLEFTILDLMTNKQRIYLIGSNEGRQVDGIYDPDSVLTGLDIRYKGVAGYAHRRPIGLDPKFVDTKKYIGIYSPNLETSDLAKANCSMSFMGLQDIEQQPVY
jgi:hypothetical protein